MPLPSRDFDPSEAALMWQGLKQEGHDVVFATADGKRGYADPRMLHGKGLDPWGFLPLLDNFRLVGLLLRADFYGRTAYSAMELDEAFLNPRKYAALNVCDYDAMVLAGGHAPGMRAYLENETLQAFVAAFFEYDGGGQSHKLIAAVCHGVLLAARSKSPTTGRSVLYGRKTTALTWKLENSAWQLAKWWARPWDSSYYRTYTEDNNEPAGYWGVQQEVTRALRSPHDFIDVTASTCDSAWSYFKKTAGIWRDTPEDHTCAFVVRDQNFVSARWPGDVHTLCKKLVSMLNE